MLQYFQYTFQLVLWRTCTITGHWTITKKTVLSTDKNQKYSTQPCHRENLNAQQLICYWTLEIALMATKDFIIAQQELTWSKVSLPKNCMKHTTDMSRCNNSQPLLRIYNVLCLFFVEDSMKANCLKNHFTIVQLFKRNPFKSQVV